MGTDGGGPWTQGGGVWGQQPGLPQWVPPPPPPGLYTAAKFRLSPELVPIRDAFPPPPPGPPPRAGCAYKAWAGRAAAHTVSAMALSEPILPSFATFASPCERGLQEVRAMGDRGWWGSKGPGHRMWAQRRGLGMASSREQTAGGGGDLGLRRVRLPAVRS